MVPNKPRYGGVTHMEENNKSISNMAESLSAQGLVKMENEREKMRTPPPEQDSGERGNYSHEKTTRTRTLDLHSTRLQCKDCAEEKEEEELFRQDFLLSEIPQGNEYKLEGSGGLRGAQSNPKGKDEARTRAVATAITRSVETPTLTNHCDRRLPSRSGTENARNCFTTPCEEATETKCLQVKDNDFNCIDVQLGLTETSTVVGARHKQRHSPLKQIKKLFEVFGTLGIETKARLYTKLSSEEKQYWKFYFQNNAKSNDLFLGKLELEDCSPEADDLTNPKLAGQKSHSDDNLVYCKNLLLKDRKGQFYLVIMTGSCKVDLKQLKQQLNASRNLSFATDESLESILQLKPGEVTPFAIMHESARDVRVVLLESLSGVQKSSRILLAFHPFSPALQVEITLPQLKLFFDHLGKQLEILGPKDETATYSPTQQQQIRDTPIHENQNAKSELKEMAVDVIIQARTRTHTTTNSPVGDNVLNYNTSQMSKESTPTEKNIVDKSDDMDCSVLENEPMKEMSQKSDDDSFSYDHTKNVTNSSSLEIVIHDNELIQRASKAANKLSRIGERKGKLRSFIKKNVKNDGENEKTISGDPTAIVQAGSRVYESQNRIDQRGGEIRSVSQAYYDGLGDAGGEVKRAIVNLNELSPNKYIPEINEFYTTLTSYNIEYREINVSTSTSNDIGPALGVKCFLLKDKRKNYFVVITHEFYELDFGRLKKSLNPKKKLEECDSVEVMEVLGVHRDQFTPFSIMNERVKRNNDNNNNNIKIFFTQKISDPNIILCIPHPFGKGSRILMKYSELKRLLEKFNSNEVGTVEEKVWQKKYNRAFSQFSAQPDTSSNNREKCYNAARTESKIESDNNNIPDYDNTDKEEQKGRLLSETDRIAYSGNTSSSFTPLTSKLMDCFRNFPTNMMYYFNQFGVKTEISGNLDMHNFHDSESCVDGDELFFYREIPKNYFENDDSTAESVHNLNRANSPRFHDTSSQLHSHSENYHTNETCLGVYANTIKQHLNEYGVKFYVKEKKAKHLTADSEDIASDNDSDEDEDDIKMSQVCSTLHLTDETGSNHYIIVGRKSEHVSLRRFCRIFHIAKRLYVVLNENDDTHFDDVSGTSLPFTNDPFSVILSRSNDDDKQQKHFDANDDTMAMCNVSDPDKRDKVSYELVLHTSIYMDPEMECVFELDRKGTRVCMSSEEFENYSKRVGMEVWYMP